MAPTSKKSKLTMSSASLAGGSSAKLKSKSSKREEEVEDRLSDLDRSGSDGEAGSDFGGDDEFDLGEMSGEEGGDGGKMDTDDEIEQANEQGGKSKKTAKRKRRAASPSTFGNLLTTILDTDPVTSFTQPSSLRPSKPSSTTANVSASAVQSQNILSLAPSVRKTLSARKLESRAKRVLQNARVEKEDRGRIRDVLTGWGGTENGVGGQDWERSLRKVAQKGVVRLFNTILQSSAQVEEATAGKKGLAAPEPLPDPRKGKKKEKDNLLGRGGREREGARVTKEGFEALLKGGA
ncbi:Protein of unknown function DUF1665 [Phaffia rhodozyma]|uniref:Rrp15p-domain-containing protein n=1 Tax=Phaffia rhodozyma TaxID=264483 RepID=A0A0F7SRM3_PHARH|nr:Protein of unknown function DUF1665 [Phaffia rhodozyma]